MKSKILLYLFPFILLISKNLIAMDIMCNFEEVYQNGDIQNGHLLIKNNKIRYEYLDKSLYTIIYDQNILVAILNRDRNNRQNLQKSKDLFDVMNNIFNSYSDIQNSIEYKDYSITLERSLIYDFFKRLYIKSPDLNLSIYLNDCQFKTLDSSYFRYYPFKELI